jgi:hypothetical protein
MAINTDTLSMISAQELLTSNAEEMNLLLAV